MELAGARSGVKFKFSLRINKWATAKIFGGTKMNQDETLVMLAELESIDLGQEEAVSSRETIWTGLHDSIMDSFLDGEEEWLSDAVKSLARLLKCEIEELQLVINQIHPDLYAVKRLEKLLERQNMGRLGYNWSNLEAAVVQKLGKMVQMGAIKSPSDLLAIAKTANGAIRRGVSAGVPTHIPNTELPGAGSLGKIELHLSHRTVEQLSRNRVIDLSAERLEDRISMLGAEDIAELTLIADKGTSNE